MEKGASNPGRFDILVARAKITVTMNKLLCWWYRFILVLLTDERKTNLKIDRTWAA